MAQRLHRPPIFAVFVPLMRSVNQQQMHDTPFLSCALNLSSYYSTAQAVAQVHYYTPCYLSVQEWHRGCHFSTDSISMPCLVLLIGVAVWRLQLRPCFTTGNPIVAECKISSTRQTCHLPGAWRKTLGKKFHKSRHIACLNTNYKY